MLYLSYMDLSPGHSNLYSGKSHQALIRALRNHFQDWTGFSSKFPDFSLGVIVVTKMGVAEIDIKGPSISKKHKVVDYSIFLPETIKDIEQYLDFVFTGLASILEKYGVNKTETLKIR